MDHMPGMEGMAPPTTMGTNHTHASVNLMHMTFYWGKNSEVLFSGWPGTRTGMYVLALVLVFVLAIVIEWLSNSRFVKDHHSNLTAGLLKTAMHTIRVGLAYLLMLALMSFNVGVFLVIVAGHALGFLLFGSKAFQKSTVHDKLSPDLPPLSC